MRPAAHRRAISLVVALTLISGWALPATAQPGHLATLVEAGPLAQLWHWLGQLWSPGAGPRQLQQADRTGGAVNDANSGSLVNRGVTIDPNGS